MFEIKIGSAGFVPVRLFNVNGDPFTSVVYTSVTASILKADTSIVSIGVSSSDWSEATGSNWAGTGMYLLKLPTSVLTITGSFNYCVGGGVPTVSYIGSVCLVDNIESDTFNRLGTPTGPTIASDIAAITVGSGSSAGLGNLSASLEVVKAQITTLSGSLVNVSASLWIEVEAARANLTASLVTLSSSLRTEVIGNRLILESDLTSVSASLWTEVEAVRTNLSASVVTLSSSLRTEIISGGGILTLSASLVNISSSLRLEDLTTRSVLSSSMVNISSSLRNEILAGGEVAVLSASIVNLSASLRTEILSARDNISGSLSIVNSRVISVATNVSTVKMYAEGRWKIFTTGPDTNRLVLYDPSDDTTVLLKFDLKDSTGAAVSINPYERVPV